MARPTRARGLDRCRARAVAPIAGLLLAFEFLTHRQILFVTDSLSAMTAIAIAVLGMALGSAWVAWMAGAQESLVPVAARGLAAALAIAVAGFPVLGPAPPWAVPLLPMPSAASGESGKKPRVG